MDGAGAGGAAEGAGGGALEVGACSVCAMASGISFILRSLFRSARDGCGRTWPDSALRMGADYSRSPCESNAAKRVRVASRGKDGQNRRADPNTPQACAKQFAPTGSACFTRRVSGRGACERGGPAAAARAFWTANHWISREGASLSGARGRSRFPVGQTSEFSTDPKEGRTLTKGEADVTQIYGSRGGCRARRGCDDFHRGGRSRRRTRRRGPWRLGRSWRIWGRLWSGRLRSRRIWIWRSRLWLRRLWPRLRLWRGYGYGGYGYGYPYYGYGGCAWVPLIGWAC